MMAAPPQPRTPRLALASTFALAVALLAGAPLVAHVALLAPDGGELLDVGESVTVEWLILVEHNTQNWDLWYSSTGPDGPWLPIATDLPPGNTAENTVHTFQWTVPDDPSTQVRVRVRQDNVGTDWLDASDADLTIRGAGALFTDGFESGDTAAWSNAAGAP